MTFILLVVSWTDFHAADGKSRDSPTNRFASLFVEPYGKPESAFLEAIDKDADEVAGSNDIDQLARFAQRTITRARGSGWKDARPARQQLFRMAECSALVVDHDGLLVDATAGGIA